MEKRHQDNLTNRLEEAFLVGMSHIAWEELYQWYGVQKIAARTYRDLEERWQDLSGNGSGKLMKIEARGGIFIFGESKVKSVDQTGNG